MTGCVWLRQVHLNRGNHEDRLLCQAYSFRSELEEKYADEASDLFTDVVAVFQALPLAATIREPEPEPEQEQHGDTTSTREGIVVMHAGLPGADSPDHRRSLAGISTIDRMQIGLDSVCGKVEPHTDRAAVSDIVSLDGS